MHRLGKYTASDRMSDLVCGNYHILLIMSRFGIALGFGDRTVDEVCRHSEVDTTTFLAVVNLLYDEGTTSADCRNISLDAFLRYLHNSHDYFLQYRLPDIRRKLTAAVACGRNEIADAIVRFFDDYAAEVHKHMMYEEETVFPYVRHLLSGDCPAGYDIETFHRQHDQIDLVLPHQRRQRVLIGRLIRKILSPHDLRWNAALRGACQSVSVTAACDHQRDLAARQLARLLRVKQRL